MSKGCYTTHSSNANFLKCLRSDLVNHDGAALTGTMVRNLWFQNGLSKLHPNLLWLVGAHPLPNGTRYWLLPQKLSPVGLLGVERPHQSAPQIH